MKRNREVLFFFSLVIISCLFGCTESESTIGFPELDSKIQTVMIDTFTVRTSTVLLDSVNSSGTSKIIVGSYTDPVLGKISSSSYFQITPNPASWSIEKNAVFDSVALLLTPDQYYYGDTAVIQELIVQQLSQDLAGRETDKNIFKDVPYSYFYSDGGIYNTSKTAAFGNELAHFKYSPRPHSSDSVIIRLKDDLGEYWFELAKVNDHQIANIGNFLAEFKGLKISAKQNAAVIGFNSAKAKVRVYYHISSNSEYTVNASFDLPIFQSDIQYNQFESDLSSTTLSSLQRGQSIASTFTNHESFIQGGSGVITKVEFPYLHLLNEVNENVTILRASLVVSVVKEYPQVYNLPSEICLYYTNDLNIPTNFVADEITLTKTNTAKLSTDKELGQFSQYPFLVTSYVTSLIKNEESYPKELFIGLNLTDLPGTVTRLRLGGENHPDFKIKLQVYYSRYQNSQ
ncbi:MAG TPA: DUF4270 family protein [Cyclobacteriaceae bacterium]